MRVWDVHPGYLTRNSLLGQHAEIHALFNVIKDCKKGYGAHPETLRWKGHLNILRKRHDLTVKEMVLRGYRHASPCREEEKYANSSLRLKYINHPAEQLEILREKYLKNSSRGRIPLPRRGSDFWAHHKYSVMARGYNYYKDIQSFLRGKKDLPVKEERELIEKVTGIMEKPVPSKALVNLIHHLWGYFKDKASETEKEEYLNFPRESLSSVIQSFYQMARKYDQEYLLQSTVFADLLEEWLRDG
ncbi:MAG: DUF1722 domain-containing protein [Candidatus Syntrophonatronum acetioxidans]|uniref:DUF1722 domain-containing protein n=1 Tax=Candidatus Syntrophonatronum acetioxidans TaxID=1795816 RepID=A0A424YGU5_9FIRM|nr:MAG: DUF1722 domain-containing protein [Candidatus Syntrophonatronum acetioxidans]